MNLDPIHILKTLLNSQATLLMILLKRSPTAYKTSIPVKWEIGFQNSQIEWNDQKVKIIIEFAKILFLLSS